MVHLARLVLFGCAKPHFVVHAKLDSIHFRLANGLDVILHPDASFRSTAVDVRYDVGGRHDPEGRSGLAHLIEHLTYRAKPDGTHDAFALLEDVGCRAHNASTTSDATEYYETVGAEDLPLALFIEAARMARPLDGVDEATFDVEREIVRNERRERYDNAPHGNLVSVARFELFDGHPYARPPIGFPDDLDRLTLNDAKRFAATYYHPNNATLVVAGRIDVRRTTELVHGLFDGTSGRAPPTTFLGASDRSGTPDGDGRCRHRRSRHVACLARAGRRATCTRAARSERVASGRIRRARLS